MEYAIQLFLPILGGLLLGNWLHERFGLSRIWMLILAILGMAAGIAILYRRQMYTQEGERRFPTPLKISKKSASKTAESHLSHDELLELYKDVEARQDEEDTDDFALGGLLGDDEEPDARPPESDKSKRKPHDNENPPV